MTALLMKLLLKLVTAKIDAELARKVPVGGTVTAEGVAHGIKAFGHRWEIDAVLRRTE